MFLVNFGGHVNALLIIEGKLLVLIKYSYRDPPLPIIDY